MYTKNITYNNKILCQIKLFCLAYLGRFGDLQKHVYSHFHNNMWCMMSTASRSPFYKTHFAFRYNLYFWPR